MVGAAVEEYEIAIIIASYNIILSSFGGVRALHVDLFLPTRRSAKRCSGREAKQRDVIRP
jgi:hypothetical protein